MLVIFTITDTNGKVTRSVPTEMETVEMMQLANILQDFTKLSYFKMSVKEGGILRQVYYNPKQIVSLGIEEVQ